MDPTPPHSEISPAGDAAYTTTQAALTSLTAHMHLFHRRVLRADGLTTLERDLLLGTLVAMRGDLETLARQLDEQRRVTR